MSADKQQILNRLAELGIPVIPKWEWVKERAAMVERLGRLRRERPTLFRAFRREAFEMRQELAEDLPGIPMDVVAEAACTVLTRVAALAIGMGADPVPVSNAVSVASMAVLDELWEAKGGDSRG